MEANFRNHLYDVLKRVGKEEIEKGDKMKFYQTWTGVRCADEENEEVTFRASVPGNIQDDYAKAMGWGDLNYRDNCLKYRDIEDCTWQYRAKLRYERHDGERVFFVSHGIDYYSSVSLNGKEILRHEGMFSDVECELTDILTGDDYLTVTVYPHPKRKDAVKGTRDEADTSVKAPVCYGWDWHPRILYSGMWQETYIETRADGFIGDVQIHYTLSEDFGEVTGHFDIDCEGEVTVEITDRERHLIWRGDGKDFKIKNPRLWWCNGHGEPYLYNYRVSSRGGAREGKIGFKSVRLVMAKGEWQKPDHYPMSRSNPPICIELNGKRIFAKGTNMPTPEIFPGTVTRERYEQLIRAAKEANMNIVRMWGGCGIQKDMFYDLCDEYGIMVWQEFPLACNQYGRVDCEHYCKVLSGEARSIILRLRNKACLVLWCGGNELFNSWSLMTDQSYPLRLLDKLTLELSPEIPFIMTSPQSGMAHGPYSFCSSKYRSLPELFRESEATAYTEFGCWTISPRRYLRTFLTDDDIDHPTRDPDGVWSLHHANEKIYTGSGDRLRMTLDRFGFDAETYDEKCDVMNLLQAEGLRFVFEEGRRQAPTCSMTVNWFFTEPWKVIAGDSLMLYPDEPRPSYRAVRDALRPVLASARYEKFDWRAGEMFSAEIWLLNDTGEDAGDVITAVLELAGRSYRLAAWDTGVTKENILGPTVHMALPDEQCDYMILKLISDRGNSSEYRLRYLPAKKSPKSRLRQMNAVNQVD